MNNKTDKWEAVYWGGQFGSPNAYKVQGPLGELLANGREQAEAVTALLNNTDARVPDLLAENERLREALERALNETVQPTRNPSGFPVGEPAWCEQARAALAQSEEQ